MSQEVTVHVNRGSADSLETAVGTLEVRGSFDLHLQSHDTPAHVHCRLKGDIERIVTLPESNYYVEADDETIVLVRVNAEAIERPLEGTLEVLTGYGSESLSIPVTVKPAPGDVDVDESLSKPAQNAPEPSDLDRLIATVGLEPATLGVVVLGLVAVGIAVLTAATIGGPVAMAGLAIVSVGFLVALVLLLR
ncbi:DUF7524 family protein [Natronorubrum bangense]|uniref:Uncharacterized protein n=2 Tax=Natronorubrum bangense TaxID=61858 RepID=A0A4D6HQT8_9EURY|nr:hypothetical protein [Natronorubrum bangense]ELY43227.1 hypothetical protein C494_19557 [Natronorubrum bangense JCM 10635]QCC53315.1 hypothetical protein DV706_01755 [Natronorubrum bangense]QCC55991.1 hypothetical protein DV706_15515 [Natronorubrum bangense]